MKIKLLLIALAIAGSCYAKDIKTVVLTTNPQMHCANCEKKIKDNIRFEKGIKSIKTNLEDKTITIEYDADKTNVPNIYSCSVADSQGVPPSGRSLPAAPHELAMNYP